NIPYISTEFQTLDLSSGRLRKVELDSRVSNIQTLTGAGQLGAVAHIAASGDSNKFTASLFGARDVPLADLLVEGSSARPEITVKPRATLDGLLESFTPFFPAGGMDLGGITPQARIKRIHAGLRFERSTWTGLDAQVDLDEGPLASFIPQGESRWRRFDLSLERTANLVGNSLHIITTKRALDSERASFNVVLALPRFSWRARVSLGGDIQATLDLKTAVHGILLERGPAPNPVLRMATDTINNITRQVDN